MQLSDFRKLSTLLAREHRITTVQSNKWDSDIIKREVTFSQTDVTDLSDKQTIALLLHEIAHIHYTTKWDPTKKEQKELQKIIMDTLDDLAVEHLISQDYANAEEILKETMDEVHAKLRESIKQLPLTKYEKAMYFAVMELENPTDTMDTEEYETAGRKVEKYIRTNKDNILNRRKTKDLLPHSEEIIKLLIEEMDKPTEQEEREMQARNNQGENGSDRNGNKGQSAANALKSGLLNGKGAGSNQPQRDVMVDAIPEIIDQAQRIGEELLNILKENNAMKFEGRYRAGKLPNKRLIKTRTAKDMRPFTKRIDKNNRSYAFAIATDVSGSMFGAGKMNANSKLAWSTSSAFMTAEALQIAGVSRKVIHFGETAATIPKDEKEQIKWEDIAMYPNVNGGTSFSSAIKKGIRELDEMSAERKIFILLTDGEDGSDNLAAKCEEAKAKGIELIGITLLDGSNQGDNTDHLTLSQLFGTENNIVIYEDNLAEVGDAFIKILETTITKFDAT